MEEKIIPCPFCGDKMRKCPSVMNKLNILDGVKHIERNNNCPVGVSVYKIEAWNTRSNAKKSDSGQLLKEAIVLLNRWMDDPDESNIVPDTYHVLNKYNPHDQKSLCDLYKCKNRDQRCTACTRANIQLIDYYKEDK